MANKCVNRGEFYGDTQELKMFEKLLEQKDSNTFDFWLSKLSILVNGETHSNLQRPFNTVITKYSDEMSSLEFEFYTLGTYFSKSSWRLVFSMFPNLKAFIFWEDPEAKISGLIVAGDGVFREHKIPM